MKWLFFLTAMCILPKLKIRCSVLSRGKFCMAQASVEMTVQQSWWLKINLKSTLQKSQQDCSNSGVSTIHIQHTTQIRCNGVCKIQALLKASSPIHFYQNLQSSSSTSVVIFTDICFHLHWYLQTSSLTSADFFTSIYTLQSSSLISAIISTDI